MLDILISNLELESHTFKVFKVFLDLENIATSNYTSK